MMLPQANRFRNEHHIHVYGTDIPEPVATFDQLQADYSIDTRIMSNLRSMGFHTPTVIEMQAIPVMLHVSFSRTLLALLVIYCTLYDASSPAAVNFNTNCMKLCCGIIQIFV